MIKEEENNPELSKKKNFRIFKDVPVPDIQDIKKTDLDDVLTINSEPGTPK